ncbi:MAG TPA: glutathione ABC transporter substrate-binding protein [bacterium]|nr:glutathione ABC transporter substrate-binding protein [bacterium]
MVTRRYKTITRRRLLRAAGAGAAGAALYRLGVPGVRMASAQGARTMTIGLWADVISLDPYDSNDNLSPSIARLVYDGLLGFTPEEMKLRAELATSWEVSKDARVFTFHLRQGVRFHDGTPFNAAAVKVNLDRARDPGNKLKRASLYEPISSVDVVNDSTVRLTLHSPFGAMLYALAHMATRMISPTALAKGADYVARNAVGTGPFKFVSWAPGQQVMLERNPDFWQTGQSRVDRLVIKPVPEDAVRVPMLLSGEAQFVYPIPGVQVDTVSKAPGVTIQKRWSIYQYYVAMNCQHEPFRDVRVRQAMNYAVDKDALVKIVLRDFGRPLEAPMAPGVAGYSPVQAGGWPYDVAKAKALLTEAGFPRGFETTLWSTNQTENMRVGEMLQQMLAKVGVTVHLAPMEAGTLTAVRFKPISENQSQMNLVGWSSSTGDADWALRPLYGGASWVPTLFNLSFYKNPQVDTLLGDALATADQSKRNADYAAINRQIWNDAPSVFLYNSQIIAGVRNGATGVYATPDGTVDLREAGLTGT